MSCYFIAQITIKDKVEYQKYLDKAGEIFRKYNGKYLVIDDKPEVLEGRWDCTRTVVIQFNSTNDLKLWYESAEYQEILKYRLAGAACNTIIAQGLDV